MRLPVFMGLRIVSPQEQDGNPGQEGQGQPGNQCPDAKNVAHVQACGFGNGRFRRDHRHGRRHGRRCGDWRDGGQVDNLRGSGGCGRRRWFRGGRGRSNHQLLSDL